jgi:hypothetical protein
MAITKGTDGVIKIVASALDSGSETTAAVGQVRSFDFSQTADTIEKTVMGDDERQYMPSLTTATLSVEAYFDTADTTHTTLTPNATIDWELSPQGLSAGKTISGEGIVTSRTITAAFDGAVEATFEIQVHGTISETSN